MSLNNPRGKRGTTPVNAVINIKSSGVISFYTKANQTQTVLMDFSAKTIKASNEKNKDVEGYTPMVKPEIGVIQLLKTPIDFCYIDDNYFIRGLSKVADNWFQSGTYQRVDEHVRVYFKGERTPAIEGVKGSQDVSNWIKIHNGSTCMNVFGLTPKNLFTRIEMQASGRSAFMNFKNKVKGGIEQTPFFRLTGLIRSLMTEQEGEERTVFLPVFEIVQTTDQNKKVHADFRGRAGQACTLWEAFNGDKTDASKIEKPAVKPSQEEAENKHSENTEPTPEPAPEDDLPF